MKLSTLSTSQNKKILLYGNSGAGKTCFAAGAPTPMLVFDFDGKISSAAAFYRESDPKRLDEIEFENYTPAASQGGLSVFKRFEHKILELEAEVKKGAFPYKTIVVDSLTTFSDSMMQLAIAENPGVKGPAPGVPGLQHYSIVINKFIPMLSRVLALPCNVVMTAHIKADKNEQTGDVTYKPMLSGSLPERLPIVFEEVYRAFVESKEGKTVHVAQTRSDFRYNCRTQIRNIPQYIPLSWTEVQKHLTK